ncbi:MAG: class I SAM-dependent methyltransferase [Spirochaetaceae bacterium]|nr:class I SAM-dependent methyltransferase [Spirochaetaceae bacterium]
MDPRLAVNRQNWNERVPVHAASDFYGVDRFKAGAISLNDIEREEVGPVAGKSLLHLQCHFGMDTMSWSRLGARATGVDFSDAAIELARDLNAELGLGTRFIRSNVYDLPDVLDEQFDVVYTASGVLVWLPDLAAWAKVVARFLKPGGTFYLFEGHPLCHIFADDGDLGDTELRVRNPYFPDPDGTLYGGDGYSYAGDQRIPSPSYEWRHSMAETLNALLDAGLRLQFLREFPLSNYRALPGMVRCRDGWWRLPENNASIPQMFSLKATR